MRIVSNLNFKAYENNPYNFSMKVMWAAPFYLLIFSAVNSNLTFISLRDVTIFSEQMGPAKLYHTTWHLYTSINTSELQTHLAQLYDLYFQIKMSNGRMGDDRQKRGFLNVVGSVSKTLFSTLTESELEYVHSELKKLHEDNRVLAFSISNQTQVPIPQKQGTNFLAPVPRDEYILVNDKKTFYVLFDKYLLK